VLRAALVLSVLWLLAMPRPVMAAPGTYGERLGAHSMIYLNSTPDEQETAFRMTAAAGVRFMRMDFNVTQIYPLTGEDFSAVDRVNALAAKYSVEILAVVVTTPSYIAACPDGSTAQLDHCAPAPAYEDLWRLMVARVAQRATNVRFWELGNEPDIGYGFSGPADEYARWAGVAAEGIRAARPDARIAISGFARLDAEYITAALHDRAHPLIDLVDIASVHLRGSLHALRTHLAAALRLYRDARFDGPLWVTETGYPSQRAVQPQSGYRGGPRDQARWLTRGLRALVDGGAARVFVTLRDNRELGTGPYASEGIVRWPSGRPKPAFRAVQRLAAMRQSK
jgi:hypothetical protein